MVNNNQKKVIKKALKNEKKAQQRAFKTNLLNDFAFKKLFGSPETLDITKHFLEEVVGLKVKNLQIMPTDIYSLDDFADVTKENAILRTKVDLLVEIEGGELVTIELQNRNHKYFLERVWFYWSKGYISQYDEEAEELSNKFASLRTVYSVNILNFNFHEDSIPDPVMDYQAINRKYDRDLVVGQLIQKFFFVELLKITDKSPKILRQWRDLFLKGTVPKDAPEHLQRAARFIAYENLDKGERQVYIDYKEGKAIYDAQLDTVREESEVRGEKRGVKKGRKEGREEEREEIALNLLNLGIPLDQIAKATGLTLEELQKLTQK